MRLQYICFMWRINIFSIGLCLLITLTGNKSFGQKKAIGPEAWYEWRTITQIKQTHSGDWVSYHLNPLEGDDDLVLKSTVTEAETIFSRASKEALHFNDKFLVFMLEPGFDTIRQLKLNKVKKDKYPKDSLAIYWIDNDSLVKIPKIKSFELAEEGDWIAYLSEEDERPKPPSKKKKKKRKKKKKKKKKSKYEITETSGTTLHLFNPLTGQEEKIHKVKSFKFDKKGNILAYTTSRKGDKDSLTLHIIDMKDFSMKVLIENQMELDKIAFDERGSQMVFLSSMDTTKTKNFTLYHWKDGQHNARMIVDSTTKGMPEDWTVTNNMSPYFSRKGDRIYLGTSEIKREPKKDTLLESEKVKLDIWHYQDSKIQPEQLSGLKRDQRKAYLSVFLTENRKFLQLADETVDRVTVYDHGDSYYGFGIDTKPYEIERTWSSDWKADYYAVSIKGGKRTLIKKGLTLGFGSGPVLAPSGKYLMWFNPQDSSWMSFDLLSKKDVNVSEETGVTFEDDVNGVPGTATRTGTYGWTLINDEEYLLVSDKYDIWALHPSITNRTFCLSCTEENKEEIKFTLLRTERDSTYLILENSFLKGINQNTFDESIYKIKAEESKYTVIKVFESPMKFSYFNKADKSDKLIIARKDFQTYPDLESTNVSFSSIKKITNANPQQDQYNWGTVEHVDWYAYDSLKLRGLLYKPENFDPNKKYPMIVYFYSLNSQNINEYYVPKPVYSYINYTEYVSNEYIIFVPDIKYGEPGHPGKDAYNCVISGTEYLCRNHDWIDSTRLGMQGQSWGGYQTVQLITMTNKFAAAMAGAAVGNMFSAYGGIRWTSGLARTFQYEEGQSRIGYTIWEKPELYIENSPVFHLDKVNTPLMLRHNDEDGAVPWYQSIEIYLGLRRLQKPVWLLNYNGGDHWNLKLPHRIDYNIRMKQFFDHYLKGYPMPLWMKVGRPAIDKETNSQLELEK